jgi:hypothetical protein
LAEESQQALANATTINPLSLIRETVHKLLVDLELLQPRVDPILGFWYSILFEVSFSFFNSADSDNGNAKL